MYLLVSPTRPTSPLRIYGVILSLIAILSAILVTNPLAGMINGRPTLAPDFGNIPLAFVPNRGQSPGSIRFETYGLSSHLTFSPDRVRFTLPQTGVEAEPANIPTMEMRYRNADPGVQITSSGQLPTAVNYFTGNNPANWIAPLPTYSSLRYQGLYPGIDLVFEGSDSQLKSTYYLSPGTDPAQVRWQYSGARNVSTDKSGNLVIKLPGDSQVVEQAPIAWQEVGETRIPVSIAYDIAPDGSVGFALGVYESTLPLIIDPVFVFETVINGANFDSGRDIAVDADGNAYIIARAYNTNNDVLVLKVSSSGNLLYSTTLSGSSGDFVGGIALDSQGDVYLTGFTDSTNFPILNAYQPTMNGHRDAFIAKLSGTDGSLMFSTFFGGNRADASNDIALNQAGEIYIAGQTDSTIFPTINPIQNGLNLTNCFCDDSFITRFSSDASTVLYSTYLGGSFDDQARAIDLDGDGNIYIAGFTHSPDFPTQNPRQSAYAGGTFDGFVTKISADGSQLVYSTYLGGDNVEYLKRIAVTDSGVAVVAGLTESPDFPTTSGAFQEQFAGGILACGTAGFDLRNCDDAFITAYVPDGSAYAYSTFLGGMKDDTVNGIAVDNTGLAYLVGYTNSPDFPLHNQGAGAFIFVSQLTEDGSSINYTETVWSAVANDGHGIVLGANGDVYITGAMNAPSDTYIARLEEEGGPQPTPTPVPTATPAPTATPPTGDSTVHIGDLDGSSFWNTINRRWTASVTITVHDADHNPVANTSVFGNWTIGSSRNNLCVTDADGTCTIESKQINVKSDLTTLTVAGLSHPSLGYDAASNHDPDGDSEGSSITVLKP